MLVFLYEFVTGGGFLGVDGQPMPAGTLLHEGAAMRQAVREDLSLLPGIEVATLLDARLHARTEASTEQLGSTSAPVVVNNAQDERERFVELANKANLTLLIAPEFDGHLLDRVRLLERQGCSLLSPNSRFIEITADKTRTIETLAAAGVPTPLGQRIDVDDGLPTDFPLPAVLKVNDGAGSMCCVIDSLASERIPRVMRIEQFVTGLACSISFLCRGTKTPIACPPIQQILSSDGQLEYLGGKRILNSQLIDRATKLGFRALSTLPPTTGYVGIDLVLGHDVSGSGDYVIEVNPRLTTSYIGLREIATTNLAAAMLQIATGKAPNVRFSNGPVDFLPNGTKR